MKIALVTEYSSIGGGESNLLNLARELSKHAEVNLFCPPGILAEQAVKIGIRHCPIKRVVFRGWIKGIPLMIREPGLIRKLNQFDLVHCYSLHILPRVFGIKRPLIWTNHGYWEKVRGLRAWFISRFVFKTITVSSETHQYACLPAGKKTMIHLGIPAKQPADFPEFSEKQTGITIACVARYQRIKGQDLLIKALQEVALNTPDLNFKIYMVGDVFGHNKADLEFKQEVMGLIATVETLANVKILVEGFKSDVWDYYRKCDFLVVPSRYESFSMVTIEALSCGKPVIAPKAGGLKDIINSDQIGILFDPGNLTSLQEALQKMVLNYTAYCSDKCKKRAGDFSVAKQSARHLELYNECLQNK